MKSILTIIQSLSPEERKDFVSYMGKRNKRKDIKNIQLFNLLSKNPNEKDIDVQLYGKPSKNNLHALSKRVQDSLVDFTALQAIDKETTEEMELFKLILSARVFFEKGLFKIGFKTLAKAEVKASKYYLFNFLKEIYYTKIQYANHLTEEEFENLLSDYYSNQKQLEFEEQLNILYARIQRKITSDPDHVIELVRSSIALLPELNQKGFTYRSLYKMFSILNETANTTRNFYDFSELIEELYQSIQISPSETDRQLYYQIHTLYYVANFKFRVRKFEESLHFLDLMFQKMKAQKSGYLKRFLPQYSLLLGLNLYLTNKPEKSKEALENVLISDYSSHDPYILDIQLFKAVIYIQQEEFRKARRILVNLYHSDSWYEEKAGKLWMIKKNLIELILYTEVEQSDLFESHFKAIQNKIKQQKYTKLDTRLPHFLILLYKLHFQTFDSYAVFKENVKTKLLQEGTVPEDIFSVCFYAWLWAKVEKTSVYQATLDLLDH